MAKVTEKKRGRPKSKVLWAKSLQELGAMFGVSRQAIRLWIKKGAPAANASGFYNINEWKEWVDKFGSEATSSAEEIVDRAALTAKQIELKNQKLEIEIQRLRGEMLHVDDVRQKLFKTFDVCKRLQMRIGPSLAARLSGMTPVEISKEITTAIKDTYSEIERWARDMDKVSSKPISEESDEF